MPEADRINRRQRWGSSSRAANRVGRRFGGVSGGHEIYREEVAESVATGLSPLPFREWRWSPLAMALADIAALEASVALGYILRLAADPWFPIALPPQTYQGMAVGVLVLPFVYFLAQLYPGYRLPAVERLRRRVYATALVFGVLIAWDYLIQHGTWSRGILLATFAASLVLTPIAEMLIRRALIAAGRWGIPVVLIGTSNTGRKVAQLLAEQPQYGLVPVCFIDDDAALWGSDIDGVPVLGPVADAGTIGANARLALVTMTDSADSAVVELSARLPFARVIVIPNLIGLPSLWAEPCDIAGILGIEVKHNLFIRRNRAIKKILDYVLAVPLIAAAAPLTLLSAIAVKLTSPGPAFYVHERVGQGGRPIRMIKLRTMYRDADRRLAEHLRRNTEHASEWSRSFKLQKDPRVVPWVGAFLRMSSLDELPQLWNVLCGDMSLVGPRPFPQYHLEAFDPAFRALRQSVAPGLTGFWQVERRSASNLELQQALDTYYIRNWSLWLDLHILLRTIGAVLSGKGAH